MWDPTPDTLQGFMSSPPPPSSVKGSLSALSGLPRVAATVPLAVPAAAAGAAGALTGAVGAALDPDNAAEHLAQGNERLRNWSSYVYGLANKIPATEAGAQAAEGLLSVPGKIGQNVNESLVRPLVGESASQAVGDVAQDLATVAPAAGVKGAAASGARGAARAARAARDAYQAEAATVTAPNAEPAPPPTPPVGQPVTAAQLKAQPNPIPPPEGTAAATRERFSLQSAAAPIPGGAQVPGPPEISAPGASPSAAPNPAPGQRGSFSFQNDNDLNRSTAAPKAKQSGAPAPQSEYDANRQLAGQGARTPEQDEILRRLSGQRGSVQLFNSPADEGPKETPSPDQQDARKAHLDAIDKLSGGLLPERRTSALTGDYNATGDDFQMKEVGNEMMRQQLASENAAMHGATENVHQSLGSQFDNSVDPQVVSDRGRTIRNAVTGIQDWYQKATDGLYEAARAQNQGRPIPELKRVSDYLNDDSNFTNDAEIGLQRAAKQRLQRLWTTGDPDKGAPPGSVNAAERFREFLNEKGKNPSAMGVASDLKGHLDLDVAEHGGPGQFQAARALRRHQYQMLEEPTGIRKLLAPSDSQGINHAIPTEKVADYVADLPQDQHEHVLNVLRAAAHLDDPSGKLAEDSAAAMREIQAHVVSRMHAAARNADGSWNARKFYNAAASYGPKLPSLFRERPDVIENLKTINNAGNVLNMDKHYPGAGAQVERTGTVGHLLETGGKAAASIAHDIPFVGRIVGRGIESGVEGLAGRMGETSRNREVAKRLVDRNGKQRGSVQLFHGKEVEDSERNQRSEYNANRQIAGQPKRTPEGELKTGSTVKDPRRSAYPGIYDDPKDVMSRLDTVPESPHLKEIFGTTRKEMHDAVVERGDVAPKSPMPGMAPKGKGSEHAQQVTTPENAERIRNAITALKEHDPSAYHGMVAWYHSDPMYHSIKKILGGDAERASDVYHKLNTYTALASPMSSVGPEIVRGTAAATTAAEGNFDQFSRYGGLPAEKLSSKNAPALKNLELGFEGHAFHGTAQAPAMQRFNQTGEEARAVKTGAYRRASDAPSRPGSEYQNTVLVGDSHFSRGAGLADVRGAAAYDGSIEGPELKVVHPWYHENVAKPLGIPATSAQAAQWAAFSHETGVETPIGAPKLEIWADQIADAAKRAGVKPREMWERIVKRLAAK
jgi:hypothetical protein